MHQVNYAFKVREIEKYAKEEDMEELYNYAKRDAERHAIALGKTMQDTKELDSENAP
ncbi:hypothetical protein LTR47_011596 [Exophiala xenobiotica]|nr:hypothetical protein LTR92_011267 [Exophiala xenobiotica]KAK5202626.1 hypothetical protein LTR41_011633 [Exophiala xenobiotica]KAK5219265.1 hypothetical protein LTR47_011596 [Exophiala xenobiotica]KAK5243176.1 hypothetical protein LTS06_010995 [Exophiala xenobiotica]KAK5260396.1 hypothetical protein LTR40_004220 [Exophiala xenobiotica]